MAQTPLFVPRGVGGGGAMAGYSISPYGRLRFVGTDMGTLLRSQDDGASWQALPHHQVTFGADLQHASGVGFHPNGRFLFFAADGLHPKRSRDRGSTWQAIALHLAPQERLKYWVDDPRDGRVMLAATTAGLWRSIDAGNTWSRSATAAGNSVGTFLTHHGQQTIVYHATENAILLSNNGGQTFSWWYKPHSGIIHSFTGGSDQRGITLAFLDRDGSHACAWANNLPHTSVSARDKTLADCGYVWLWHKEHPLFSPTPIPAPAGPIFARTSQVGGSFLAMARHDSSTLYLTGGDWPRQYGSKVWVSRDTGRSWQLILHLYNWDTLPYSPWPRHRLEYSAIGLDVGWHDSCFTSFAINPANAAHIGATGHFFLHTSNNYGTFWKAPFTAPADAQKRQPGGRWRSTGLEVTSVLRLKFHPTARRQGYASVSDIGGLVTEDGGATWRITGTGFNTTYDFAFDPQQPEIVFAAAGNLHDWPLNGSLHVYQGRGGIFKSTDTGHTWTLATPPHPPWNRQYLSLAHDARRQMLYAGTQGVGVVRSSDNGHSWHLFNNGLPNSALIVPQIELDPTTGDAYLLLTGDSPEHTNHDATGIYWLDVAHNATAWQLLRQTVHRPAGIQKTIPLWLYPTVFAIEYDAGVPAVLWLADMEVRGAHLASGVWRSVDRGHNWHRMLQFTHPSGLHLDDAAPPTIYAAGLYQMDGQWGQGGLYYSYDRGLHWRKELRTALQSNFYGVVSDPNHPQNIFYLFFGGGMLYGPKPAIADNPRQPSL